MPSPSSSGEPQPDASSAPVPAHNRDPVLSLRPCPVWFTVQGVDFEIPALPAVEWLSILMRSDWSPDDVLIELAPGGLELVLQDTLDPEDTERLCLDIVEAVTGRHWWIALGLIQVIQDGWHVAGPEMIMAGIDPAQLSLAAWLDTMMLVVLRLIRKEDQAMFLARLEMPPAATEVPVEEMEMSRDQFMSMMRG